jgi:hypothetical protein
MKTPEMLDMAIARHLIEVMLDRCKSDDAFETNATAQYRKALHKSLESSRMLMSVAHQLMVQPESLTPRDSTERLKALLEEIKTAARTAYQAGLLLTGRE